MLLRRISSSLPVPSNSPRAKLKRSTKGARAENTSDTTFVPTVAPLSMVFLKSWYVTVQRESGLMNRTVLKLFELVDWMITPDIHLSTSFIPRASCLGFLRFREPRNMRLCRKREEKKGIMVVRIQ